jgi:hypothetical protein
MEGIRSGLLNLLIFFLTISLPSSVKCDMGETLSTFILFFIIMIFIFAGLGFWSRRQENK